MGRLPRSGCAVATGTKNPVAEGGRGGAQLPQKARRIRKGRPLTGQRLRDAIQLTPLPILQAIVTRSAMPGEYPEVDNRIFVFNLEMGQFVMPPGDELGLTDIEKVAKLCQMSTKLESWKSGMYLWINLLRFCYIDPTESPYLDYLVFSLRLRRRDGY